MGSRNSININSVHFDNPDEIAKLVFVVVLISTRFSTFIEFQEIIWLNKKQLNLYAQFTKVEYAINIMRELSFKGWSCLEKNFSRAI